ncbi:MAG: hypothetical protein IJH58_06170, partial [Clostridia bacterium]|nr:hypothetical protein [Clostridia bacterium]
GRNGQTPAEDHGHEDRDQGSFSRFHAVSFPSGGARNVLSFSASILLDYVKLFNEFALSVFRGYVIVKMTQKLKVL